REREVVLIPPECGVDLVRDSGFFRGSNKCSSLFLRRDYIF
ncbi:unnamed protein product, partial [Brassica oleracea]